VKDRVDFGQLFSKFNIVFYIFINIKLFRIPLSQNEFLNSALDYEEHSFLDIYLELPQLVFSTT